MSIIDIIASLVYSGEVLKEMKTAFCLINHQLTEKQTTELKEKFDIQNIVYPTPEITRNWAQIPATEELDNNIITSVITWLYNAKEGDVLIVQGEAGASFMIVDYALKHKLIPVHAVSVRVSREVNIGELIQKQNVFEHVCFRKYNYYAPPIT